MRITCKAALFLTTIFGATSGEVYADNSPARKIISTDFGETWPLTAYSAAINCVHGGHAIAITSTGIYAMNGIAKGFAEKYGYKDIQEISKAHPEYEGVEADITPLLELALEMCSP